MKIEVKGQKFYVKDLQKISKDLSKTVIVDNVPESYSFQTENGLCIKSWYTGDDSD